MQQGRRFRREQCGGRTRDTERRPRARVNKRDASFPVGCEGGRRRFSLRSEASFFFFPSYPDMTGYFHILSGSGGGGGTETWRLKDYTCCTVTITWLILMQFTAGSHWRQQKGAMSKHILQLLVNRIFNYDRFLCGEKARGGDWRRPVRHAQIRLKMADRFFFFFFFQFRAATPPQTRLAVTHFLIWDIFFPSVIHSLVQLKKQDGKYKT